MLPPFSPGYKFDRFKSLGINCNRVCKWTQHVTSNNVRSCWPTMLRLFARGFTIMSCKLFCLCVLNNVFWLDLSLVFKLRANGRNNSQQCWELLRPCANGCNNSQQHATTYMQQGVQTVTCNIQQCCVRLHGALYNTVSIELWLYASPLYSKPCARPFFQMPMGNTNNSK